MIPVRNVFAAIVLVAIVFCTHRLPAAQPSESLDRNWLVTSLLNGSRLANRNLFDIAFEPEPSSNSIKFIWIASSDGLHRYDGYQWQRYGKSDGLPSNFVRSVLVTRAGKVWVGTDAGAGVFDGKSFTRFGSDAGLAGQNVRRIIEDAVGDLWFCSDSWPRANGAGGLARLHNGQWQSWSKKDGLPSDYVVNYFRSAEGRQFVATSEGLAQFDGDRFTLPLAKVTKAGMNWGSTSMAESPAIGLMVSTGNAVFINRKGSWKVYRDTLRHEHGITITADGKIIACGGKGPNQKVFAEWAGDHWQPISATFPVTHDYVENLREGPDGSIYAIGFDCLRRWQRHGSEWRVYSGMPKPLFVDEKDSLWLMDNRGFYRTRGDRWENLGTPGRGLFAASHGFWSWDTGRLLHWTQGSSSAPATVSTGITNYRNVNLDRQENPWIFGGDAAGAHKIVHLVNGRPIAVPLTNSLWAISTPDPVAGMWYLVHRKDGSNQLLKLGENSASFDVPPELVSQYTNSIYADSRGYVWLMGDTGLHRWRNEAASKWEKISAIHGASVAGCLQHGSALWFIVDGTLGGKSGLARFKDDAWKTFDTDPIFSWSAGNDQLLLGSKSKFYVVSTGGDAVPLAVRLPEPEPVMSVLRDHSGTYWIGTPQGTFLFDRMKAAPETVVVASDAEVLDGSRFRDRVRGVSRFNPSAPAANFSFSWRTDNGPWSAFTAQPERGFNARGLSLGNHHVFVRVRDNSLNIDPSPADITFRVLQLPLQERRWFWAALVAVGVLLTALTITTAAARFKLSRQASKLEDMVEARTAELKLREEELRRSNRALQRTNDDLRQFSWAASHDLQEPLGMVVTYTQFLAKRYSDKLDDTGRQFMSYAVDGAYRTQSLLQALLEYWQVNESGEEIAASPVDSSAILKKALTNLEIMVLEREAVVTFSNLPTLMVSEVALMQLFQNLISNAIKYTKPGESPRIEVTAASAGAAEWQFSVKDNGIGIASEYRSMVFQLFKRLNGNRYAGTGVGLALCAKIVENFGGKIWVESEVGVGSTFHFTVPNAEHKQ